MKDGRPPRAGALILALAAVLVLMGFAFWRAVTSSGARSTAKPDDPAALPTARDDGEPKPPPGAPPAPGPGAGGGVVPAAPPPSRAAASAPGAPPGRGEFDEPHLMAKLRVIKDQEPQAAVVLARQGNQRFPDSADAPERTSILIHALVAIDKGSEARGEAEHMVNHYPDSSWVRDVEHFTGAHRHRNVSVNDAGQLIFR